VKSAFTESVARNVRRTLRRSAYRKCLSHRNVANRTEPQTRSVDRLTAALASVCPSNHARRPRKNGTKTPIRTHSDRIGSLIP
jgi:hypothetical protein